MKNIYTKLKKSINTLDEKEKEFAQMYIKAMVKAIDKKKSVKITPAGGYTWDKCLNQYGLWFNVGPDSYLIDRKKK